MLPDPLHAAIVVAILRAMGFGVSALLAYLGYRLFLLVPQQTESGGKIETPGLTITLSRIGPGTFFAVCAAAIVTASFVYPIKITSEGVMGAIGDTAERSDAEKLEFGSRPALPVAPSAKQANEAHIASALRHLACIRGKPSLDEDEQTAVDQARVALIGRLWREKWRDFSAFEAWALERRGEAPVKAVEHLYTRKDARCDGQ